MRVADVMTREVETASPGDLAEEARERMRRRGFRHLVVTEGQAVVGVLSDRDLRSGAHRLGRDAQVGELMTRSVVSVAPGTRVAEAANLMRLGAISCLPVVDRGALVGIVTSGDLLELLTLEDDGLQPR